MHDRTAVAASFLAGNTRVVVATVAFGMGVDHPSIGAVVHLNMPRSVEDYVQQSVPLTPVAVARILHGLSGPAFPADAWRKAPEWGRFKSIDFAYVRAVAAMVLARRDVLGAAAGEAGGAAGVPAGGGGGARKRRPGGGAEGERAAKRGGGGSGLDDQDVYVL
ncbi:hypothetical protein GPECTOR_1229g488 [Gonium pectorale]|uniref:DNA 3'-5' helicase n=1 Tax=Gonium pectorale TaxID=33097 RepID=A0A150FTJ2_GONPE|nr:hypothetical protein GPECTOR_1229g488 [Gonium pectorale]|eukprot:KXZ40941.1 hypothetical protein GPECTOR_1229g488 [Gonium pectorale]